MELQEAPVKCQEDGALQEAPVRRMELHEAAVRMVELREDLARETLVSASPSTGGRGATKG